MPGRSRRRARGRDLNLGSRSRCGDAAVADDHDRLLDDFARRDVDQPVGADRDDLSVCCRGLGKCNENGDNRRVMTHLFDRLSVELLLLLTLAKPVAQSIRRDDVEHLEGNVAVLLDVEARDLLLQAAGLELGSQRLDRRDMERAPVL